MASSRVNRAISTAARCNRSTIPGRGDPLPNDDDGELPTADIDQTLSGYRASAANFKHLPPQPRNHYRRVHIADAERTESDQRITQKIRRAIQLREKWLYKRRVPEWFGYAEPRHSDYTVFVPPPYDPFDPELPPSSLHVCQWQDGVVRVFSDRKSVMRRLPQFQGASLQEFAEDLAKLMAIMNDPESRSFCYRRLMLLEERFNMYLILNDNQERLAQVAVPHRDLYNVRKVDVHGMCLWLVKVSWDNIGTCG